MNAKSGIILNHAFPKYKDNRALTMLCYPSNS